MFSHETARGSVGLTPNKYTYILHVRYTVNYLS